MEDRYYLVPKEGITSIIIWKGRDRLPHYRLIEVAQRKEGGFEFTFCDQQTQKVIVCICGDVSTRTEATIACLHNGEPYPIPEGLRVFCEADTRVYAKGD